MLWRIGIGLLLVFLCNVQSFIIDLSYSYLYLYDLSHAVSDIDFIISLLCYCILCMVRQLPLVHWYPIRYSKVCSSMMSVHLKDGVAGCCLFPRFVEVAYRW